MSRKVSFISFCRQCQCSFCWNAVTLTNLEGREDLGEQIGLKNIMVCLELCNYYQLNINVVYYMYFVKNPQVSAVSTSQ